ncbi:MAG: DUF484 family protein [Gammaproteobacteria bacterium]|nr:DUF484 family protein [Gammaproteobacteria bacterium]MCF6362651.1 DUF484 family protein [Gammaproteobacteria bacterium]
MTSDIQDISEQAVAEYLRDHRDFFAHNLWLLPDLYLPHESGGAISLVERQVAMLRTQNETQKTQMEELLQVARENDRLNTQLHQLTLLLMECQDLEGLMTLLVSRLRRDYSADVAVLHLLAPPLHGHLASHVEFVRDTGAFRAPFQHMLSTGRPFCGRLKGEQREMLFGERADAVGSGVVLPLGKGGRVGLLAIGSGDTNRFIPGSDISFLTRMAQVIAAALAGHLQLEAG